MLVRNNFLSVKDACTSHDDRGIYLCLQTLQLMRAVEELDVDRPSKETSLAEATSRVRFMLGWCLEQEEVSFGSGVTTSATLRIAVSRINVLGSWMPSSHSV